MVKFVKEYFYKLYYNVYIIPLFATHSLALCTNKRWLHFDHQ